MNRLYFSLLVYTCVWTPLFIEAKDCAHNRQQVSLGPQFIHIDRTKEGGTKQQGNLVGGYFTYDRLKRYGWYLGAAASYAKGDLKGSTEDGDSLCSKFTDVWAEGRFGYTFQKKNGKKLALTPYVGFGYAMEKNNFDHSSLLPIHFKTHFYYFSAGFLCSAHFCDNFIAGLLFRARIPYDPKCKVSHDPENESLSQKVGEKIQYRVELPITYKIPCLNQIAVTALPFFEYRPYGEHVNFPFDFFKTRLNLWGGSVNLVYLF